MNLTEPGTAYLSPLLTDCRLLLPEAELDRADNLLYKYSLCWRNSGRISDLGSVEKLLLVFLALQSSCRR